MTTLLLPYYELLLFKESSLRIQDLWFESSLLIGSLLIQFLKNHFLEVGMTILSIYTMSSTIPNSLLRTNAEWSCWHQQKSYVVNAMLNLSYHAQGNYFNPEVAFFKWHTCAPDFSWAMYLGGCSMYTTSVTSQTCNVTRHFLTSNWWICQLKLVAK